MTDYVLEILDGDQAGEVVELGDRLVIGRRPGNDLVLKDEKCSGEHAELVREDGGAVLRDLESTNGTMLDGRPIREVALQSGDVFQVGRVRVLFRSTTPAVSAEGAGAAAAAAAAGIDEPQVTRVDSARLARGTRRRSPLVMSVLVLLLVGAGAWLLFGERLGGGGGRGGGGAASDRPLVVAGNLLGDGIGDFEGDDATVPAAGGWDLQAQPDGVSFRVLVGGADAHTGTAAVGARRSGDAGEGDELPFALARIGAPQQVLADRRIRIAAHVRTSGQARGVVRVGMFSSSALEDAAAGDDDAPDPAAALRTALDGALRAGTAPATAADGYQRIETTVVVPRGVDRAVVELLAVLPSEGDAVDFDDVSMVVDGRDETPVPSTSNGRNLIAFGASLVVDGPEGPLLTGAVPVGGGRALVALAERGLLVPSDAGFELDTALLEDDDGFRIAYRRGQADGIALLLPTASADVRAARGDTGFASVEPGFAAENVTRLLLGSAATRLALRFPGDGVAVRGVLGDDAYRLELRGELGFDLVVHFPAEREAARELLREAEAARERGDVGAALDSVADLLANVPHDVDTTRAALALRGALLERQREEIAELLRESAEAEFFQARVGYQRVLAGIERVRERYGAEWLRRADELAATEAAMREGLARLDEIEGERHGELLEGLATAFEASGDEVLAAKIRSYVQEHYR